MGLLVVVGGSEEIGSGLEFAGCDYGIVQEVKAVLVEESLLVCHVAV